MPDTQLRMSFQPTIIEHLGVKMYKHTVPAIAELIANAYDACAKNVHVQLFDTPEHKIIIKDDGVGMNPDEVNNFYLRIGRNRRKEGQTSPCNRTPTGKKGLGKLALFGLGNTIEVITVKDGKKTQFTLDYSDILNSDGEYIPQSSFEENSNMSNGTTITLTNLSKKQGYPLNDYAEQIARLFNFPAPDFKLELSLNNQKSVTITNQLKYKSVTPQFEWNYSDFLTATPNLSDDYKSSGLITGKFITTEKPLKNNMKGITLFANGRMVNSPEFFKEGASSYFYSYLTGWLNVDFIDNYPEDLISTDRSSLDWKHPVTTELRLFLGKVISALETDWRKRRKIKSKEKVKEQTQIDVEAWTDTLPEDIKKPIEQLLDQVQDSEFSSQEQSEFIQTLHDIVPEYPYYHWRGLHPQIKEVSQAAYERKDYYHAFLESAKRYTFNVSTKSNNNTQSSEQGLMGDVFGKGQNKPLSVTKKYLREQPDNFFSQSTLGSIEEGQKYMSMGVVSGCRNPVAHEETTKLRSSNLFSEKDCLDALGLLSHLQRRLDDA